MKVFLVMGNDFPEIVFNTLEAAEKYCHEKKQEALLAKSGFRRMIYWRVYPFEVQS